MTDERTLRILELTAVRGIVAERTAFSPGRELAETMAPVTDLGEAERLQYETAAARDLMRASPSAGLRGARDIPEPLGSVGQTVRAAEALFAQVRPYPPLAARTRFARLPLEVAQTVEHAISP